MWTPGAKLSVYESIVEKIKREISLGILSEGEKLPSCREFALELGVNPNTVQRAYSTLEEEGVLYTIPKKGVYVQAHDPPTALKEAETQLRAFKAAGLKKEELEALLRTIYSEDGHDRS